MTILYTQPGCPRCRRIKRWFKEQPISFQEVSLLPLLLHQDEFSQLASRIEDSSQLADLSQARPDEYDSAPSLALYLQKNPSALFRPIIELEPEDAIEDCSRIEEYAAHVPAATCPESCPHLPVCKNTRSYEKIPVITDRRPK